MFGRAYDVAIIGGGLTGTTVARDAAGRGLNVFLCDKGDVGGASDPGVTSLHGGIEHLASLRFGAMRETVVEREILVRAAPHIARPLALVVPHHARQWPLFALRAGLFALDHVAPSSLPRARTVNLDGALGGPLQSHFTTGVLYSDCATDNGRLAVHNAIDARARGATVAPRQRCTIAEREGGLWRLSLESGTTGDCSIVSAKVLVNTTGGQTAEVLRHVVHGSLNVDVRPRKQAWLVVRHSGFAKVAYALPNADGQIVYALPYEGDTMLLGPAPGRHEGNPSTVEVDPADFAYLADVAEQYFRTPLSAEDVVRGFARVDVMPAAGDEPGAAGAIVVDDPPLVAPLISVFGGAVALRRRVAEDVVDRMGRYRRIAPGWTGRAVLPGGGFPRGGEGDIGRALLAAYPFVSQKHADRLVRAYGTRASAVLTGARSVSSLGVQFGADLTEAEVNYLRHEEWAETAEDVLWSRSHLGAALSRAETATLNGWLGQGPAPVGQLASQTAF